MLILGFTAEAPAPEQLEVRLNSQLLSPGPLPDGLEYPVPPANLRAYTVTNLLQDDDNTIEIKNLGGSAVTLTWGEIHVAAAER